MHSIVQPSPQVGCQFPETNRRLKNLADHGNPEENAENDQRDFHSGCFSMRLRKASNIPPSVSRLL